MQTPAKGKKATGESPPPPQQKSGRAEGDIRRREDHGHPISPKALLGCDRSRRSRRGPSMRRSSLPLISLDYSPLFLSLMNYHVR